MSTHTNRNCLLHLRDTSIKLMLGGSQALYHHCLSNSISYSGQIQHPLTAVRATLLTSPGTSWKSLDFPDPESFGLVWTQTATRNSSGILCWSSSKGADSSSKCRWNGQIRFILHRQLTRSCKWATKGPRGLHRNPSTDFQQKWLWVFQLCFTKCKKQQQVTALLSSHFSITYLSRSWHPDMSRAENALNESGITKGFFPSVPPPWRKSQ